MYYNNTGLVLEGGGMKGIYTAGVLDYFIEKDIDFSSIYGVSAGSCHMASFLSKQVGRGRDVMLDYLGDRHYMGVYSLFTTGDIFAADLNYYVVPNFLNPLDYEKIKEYPGKAYAVATNIESGEAEYLEVTDLELQTDYIRASSSLPLVSKNVKIDGKLYLDGGISDSIPIKKSIADGNSKNIVIMTKPVGYVRKPEKTLAALKVKYRKYPKVAELMANRHIVYNELVKYIEEEAEAGRLFLIRPREDSDISRLEKDKDKLNALYEEGYKEAENCYEAMLEYLNR